MTSARSIDCVTSRARLRDESGCAVHSGAGALMLQDLNRRLQIVGTGPAASSSEIRQLKREFANAPDEYLELLSEASGSN